MRDIPQCVGIILDGNRRWAKERGLSAFEGHRHGMENIEPIVLALRDRGVKHVVVFAFSTENWQRSEDEVSYLMEIFESIAHSTLDRLTKERVAVRFIGERERFAKSLQDAMADVEAHEAQDSQTTLWVCLSYGGRADIAQAAAALSRERLEITERALSARLWTDGMPDPDVIIRTGGNQRISNFLLWQSAYSELFFVKKYWPDFTPADLDAVLAEYALRERRMGV